MEMHVVTVWEGIADCVPARSAITRGDLTRAGAEADDDQARARAMEVLAGS